MIYTPQDNPKEAFILVTIMVLFGIFGGYFINGFFMLIALLFWVQYTIILSYMQFKKEHFHMEGGIVEFLLNPTVRFFLFELIAFWGIAMYVVWDTLAVGIAALIAWWLFAFNFYWYYTHKDEE